MLKIDTSTADDVTTTLQERGEKYGSYLDNSVFTNAFMKVLKKSPNYAELSSVHIETFHMIFHKISRCICGDMNYADNIHDICGYAKLLEDYLLTLDNTDEIPHAEKETNATS